MATSSTNVPSRQDVAEMLLAHANDPDVDTVLAILHRRRAERAAAAKAEARAERATYWAVQLEEMTTERFDDGMLVIEYVLLSNPNLRDRLRRAIDEALRLDDQSLDEAFKREGADS